MLLPSPRTKGQMSVEEAINSRRSRREFRDKPLSLEEVAQLLWASQGIVPPRGMRTAPSAGATFPLEVYALTGNVAEISPGLYHYNPFKHSLEKLLGEDLRRRLASAALGQMMISSAPLVLVIAADFARTANRYGPRAVQYVNNEVGHVGQNIYLQCEALGLGTCAVGAFREKEVQALLKIDQVPLYIMPVGHVR